MAYLLGVAEMLSPGCGKKSVQTKEACSKASFLLSMFGSICLHLWDPQHSDICLQPRCRENWHRYLAVSFSSASPAETVFLEELVLPIHFEVLQSRYLLAALAESRAER